MGRFSRAKFFKSFRQKQLFGRCQFCQKRSQPDYKAAEGLEEYIGETAKITARKINGNCLKHQRRMARAIKRARFLALLPFAKRA